MFKSLRWFYGLKVGSIFRFWLLESFEHLELQNAQTPFTFGGRVGEGGFKHKTFIFVKPCTKNVNISGCF